MNIQVLPPKPPRNGLSFDLHQFNRKLKPTAVRRDGNGIAFSDYEHMHTERMSAGIYRRNDYSWAHNDATVRQVLAAMISKTLYVRIHPTLEDIRFADKLFAMKGQRFQERARKYWLRYGVAPSWYSIESIRAYDTAALAGGLSKFFLGILYRTTRLKLSSTATAEQMHCTPQGVRRLLNTMHTAAKQLVAGTYKLRKRILADEDAKQKHLVKYLPKKPMKRPVFIPNPTGLCMCNCGQMTERITQTERFKGRIKGEYSMFRPGHVSRVRPGSGRPKKTVAAESEPAA